MNGGKPIQCMIAFLVVFLAGMFLLENRSEAPATSVLSEGYPPSRRFARTRLVDADEPFQSDFPNQTKIVLDTPGSRGWKQTGQFPLDFEDSSSLLSDLMERRGFAEKYRIENPQNPGRLLSQWEAAMGKKVLWTLWRIDENRTGFSWGVSK